MTKGLLILFEILQFEKHNTDIFHVNNSIIKLQFHTKVTFNNNRNMILALIADRR